MGKTWGGEEEGGEAKERKGRKWEEKGCIIERTQLKGKGALPMHFRWHTQSEPWMC